MVGVASHGVQAVEVVDGTLVVDQRGNISAQMTGERSQRVEELLVRVGDRVEKGDVLARLDTAQLAADRLIAQRVLEEARASVEVARSAQARAKLDFDRRSSLKGSPAFNRATFEDAEVELRAAESRLQSAQSNANRREAELARADLEVRMGEIKAPYDGVVLEIMTNVGAAVTQRAPNLISLLDLSRVEIAFKAPRGQNLLLKPGQSVNYTLADGKKRVAQVRSLLLPTSPQELAPVTRLQLDSADLPLQIHHNQPVKVFLGE
jgi:RND family efflux transporter MFP subunit